MLYGPAHKDSVLISVRVPSAVADQIKADAKVLGWSVSLFVRKILCLYCSGEVGLLCKNSDQASLVLIPRRVLDK